MLLEAANTDTAPLDAAHITDDGGETLLRRLAADLPPDMHDAVAISAGGALLEPAGDRACLRVWSRLNEHAKPLAILGAWEAGTLAAGAVCLARSFGVLDEPIEGTQATAVRLVEALAALPGVGVTVGGVRLTATGWGGGPRICVTADDGAAMLEPADLVAVAALLRAMAGQG